MSDWSNIAYREFWDVPRMIVAERRGEAYLFYSRFDEEADEYMDCYEVWRLPPLASMDLTGTWEGLEKRALARLPDISLSGLPFVVPRRTQA